MKTVPAPARDSGLEWRVFLTRLGQVSARVSRHRDVGRPAIVLLHGAAGSWTTWLPLLAEAERAGTPLHDVVLVDLPGWGDSVSEPTVGRPSVTVDDYSLAVADVLHSLGYRTWSAVGHSLGGFVALHLAVVEPVATRAVGLVSMTGAAVVDAIRHPVQGFRRLPAFAGLLAVMRLFAPLGGAARSLLRALRRTVLLRALVAPLFRHPSRIDAAVVAAFADEIRPAAFAQAARLAAGYDLDRWRIVTCEVVAVRGGHDAFAPASDDGMLRLAIPTARTTVVPSAGHFAHIEAPAVVLEALGAAFSPRS